MKNVRKNYEAPPPRDFNRGVDKYAEFHDRDPRTFGMMGIDALPGKLYYAGCMKHTCYASDKWGGKTNHYIHEHDKGPRLYVPQASMGTRATSLPQWLGRVNTFVKLGRCIEIAFTDPNGEEWVAQGLRGTDLYATPNGHALVVIEDMSRVEALIWGGGLGVEAVGIVH